MVSYTGEDGAERPSALELLREMIASAENLQWHHCPAGTVERDKYDKYVQLERAYVAAEKRKPKTFVTKTQKQLAYEDRMVQRHRVLNELSARLPEHE